jgi:rubredoxin
MLHNCEKCRFVWEGAPRIGEVVDVITAYLYCPRCGNLIGQKDAIDRIKTVTGDKHVRLLD